MSAFGFSLPGTQGYYDRRRSSRTRSQPGTWQTPAQGKQVGTRERPTFTHDLFDRSNLYADPGSLAGGQPGGRQGGEALDPQLLYAREDDLAQQAAEDARQAEWDVRFDELAGDIQGYYGSARDRYGGFESRLGETTSMWERMAAPDYKAVSDYALQPALAEMTRGGAQYSRTAADQLAARGLGRSGLSASLQGAGAGMAARGRGMVRAGQATTNEEMRRQAAEQLMRSQGLEVGLAELMSGTEADQARAEMALAALQSSVEAGFTQPDPFAWWALQHGLMKEDEAADFLDRQITSGENALEEATRFNLGDFFWRGLETILGSK